MLVCNNCGWCGHESELECSREDFNSNKPTSEIDFNQCPECDGTDFRTQTTKTNKTPPERAQTKENG